MSNFDINKIDEWQINDLLDRPSAEDLRMTLVNEIKKLRCFLVELRKCNYINNEESQKFFDLSCYYIEIQQFQFDALGLLLIIQ